MGYLLRCTWAFRFAACTLVSPFPFCFFVALAKDGVVENPLMHEAEVRNGCVERMIVFNHNVAVDIAGMAGNEVVDGRPSGSSLFCKE